MTFPPTITTPFPLHFSSTGTTLRLDAFHSRNRWDRLGTGNGYVLLFLSSTWRRSRFASGAIFRPLLPQHDYGSVTLVQVGVTNTTGPLTWHGAYTLHFNRHLSSAELAARGAASKFQFFAAAME